MAALKAEMVSKSGIDCMYLALVDIVELRTHLVVAGAPSTITLHTAYCILHARDESASLSLHHR